MTEAYDGPGIADGLAAPYRIEFHESIGSTNDRARELAAEGDRGVVVVADEQTGGRGRLDRTWSGPSGGVWLSILLAPELSAGDGPLLTLGAGVATARAAREAGVPAGIKWPNDVVVPLRAGEAVAPDEAADAGTEERKLAGILTERTGDAVVIGIGVNANVSAADLPAGATTIRDLVGAVDRRVFVQRLLEEFHDLASDPESILPAWRQLATTLGRRVRVTTRDGEVVGTAVDVTRPGALVVDTERGRTTITTGDCQHLRPA
jgi:BirA family biotin operon repressor/biotin-[acetyl-CoA-carboxylase] ligase